VELPIRMLFPNLIRKDNQDDSCDDHMVSLPPTSPVGKAQSRPRRGFKMPPDYQYVLKESVEQDTRDPEDQGQVEVRNQLKRFGTPSID
jgi:hypothetical protein